MLLRQLKIMSVVELHEGTIGVFLSQIDSIHLNVRRLAVDAEWNTMAVHLSGRVHQVQAPV